MESELAACPVCGADVGCGWDADSQGQAVECSTDENPWHYKVAGNDRAEAIEQHNTLARRAEIGALVERLVESHQRRVDCVRLEGRGYCAHSPSSKPPPTSATLLDALRALVKEVGGDA